MRHFASPVLIALMPSRISGNRGPIGFDRGGMWANRRSYITELRSATVAGAERHGRHAERYPGRARRRPGPAESAPPGDLCWLVDAHTGVLLLAMAGHALGVITNINNINNRNTSVPENPPAGLSAGQVYYGGRGVPPDNAARQPGPARRTGALPAN